MDLDENIAIVEYDPKWHLLFEHEAANIKTVLNFYSVHIE
jgi:GrpB-like predicted nucleotidyltransferase (UPF0157 family)